MISYSSGTSFIICGKCWKKIISTIFPGFSCFLFFIINICFIFFIFYVELLPLRTKDSFLIIKRVTLVYPLLITLFSFRWKIPSYIRGSIHFSTGRQIFNPGICSKLLMFLCCKLFRYKNDICFFLCLCSCFKIVVIVLLDRHTTKT